MIGYAPRSARCISGAIGDSVKSILKAILSPGGFTLPIAPAILVFKEWMVIEIVEGAAFELTPNIGLSPDRKGKAGGMQPFGPVEATGHNWNQGTRPSLQKSSVTFKRSWPGICRSRKIKLALVYQSFCTTSSALAAFNFATGVVAWHLLGAVWP
jgi:hypothetical protein